MGIRVSNLRLGLDEPEAALGGHLARVLGVPLSGLGPWRSFRKSLDARVKESFHFVYSAEVTPLDDEAKLIQSANRRRRGDLRVELHDEAPFTMPPHGPIPLRQRPIVVGSGPAGLVAAYFLAAEGYQPLLLERGRAVRERIHDVHRFDAGGAFEPESNYLFGEGGAGTFSDGKLTCRSSGPEVRRVLELFAASKGKPSILYDYRPHLGSNRLPAVVKALRRQIQAMGGEIRFSCRVEDLDLAVDRTLRGLATSSGPIAAQAVLLAIGHSARDTLTMLERRGVPMVPKPFQMGVRIEQPQETVNRVKYGSAHLETMLGAADYNVVARGPHDLFSFCMCAGGHVIPSVSAEGYFCTNGMSLSGRDSPFANSGLVVTVPVEQFPGTDVLAGMRLQAVYERRAFELGRGEYLCPIQRAGDFLMRRPTRAHAALELSARSGAWGHVGLGAAADCRRAPSWLAAAGPALARSLFDRRHPGRPRARGSCPIRMVRDPHSRETPGISGLYPVGEGAGYAGGIVSAAVDGLRSAMALIAKYAPLSKHG